MQMVDLCPVIVKFVLQLGNRGLECVLILFGEVASQPLHEGHEVAHGQAGIMHILENERVPGAADVELVLLQYLDEGLPSLGVLLQQVESVLLGRVQHVW